MISLAYLLHIEQMFNSYGLAGLVLAATSLGQAIAGPVTSRLMGRLGMRSVITVTIIVAAASMVAVSYVVAPIGFYIAVGFIGGLAAGLLAGAIVMGIKRWQVPKALRGVMPVVVIPPSWKTGELRKCARSPYLRTARNFLPILHFGRMVRVGVVQLVA
jgi:fructose-specific phosphotransferase system IIC component